MCPRGIGKMKRDLGNMDTELFDKILSEFHPKIGTMIDQVEHHGLSSVISLNPSTMGERLAQRILTAAPGLVCFSIDSFNSQKLMEIRGVKKPIEACLAVIDKFIKESREQRRSILKVIQMVKLDANIDERNKLDEFVDSYAGSDVVSYFTENTGFGSMSLIEQTTRGGKETILSQAEPCGTPFSEVSVLWNGDVVLCCYDYDGFNVVGNLREQTLKEIWHGEKINQIREIFEQRRTDTLPFCSGCLRGPHTFPDKKALHEKVWEEESTILDLITSANG